MNEFVALLHAYPGVVASLASAVIAGSVAVIVFAFTQFLTVKRARAELLVPKLEELYLLVNEAAAANVTICAVALRVLDGDDAARKKILALDDLDLYGHRLAKKIIMYIRLYFPQLSRIHQLMFAAQGKQNELLFALHTTHPPKLAEMVEAGGMVAHFLRLFEAEIVNNRDSLIGDRIFHRRYKPTSQTALDAFIPPPNVPMWADDVKGNATTKSAKDEPC